MGISLGGGRRGRRSYADYNRDRRRSGPRSDPFRVVIYLVLIGAGVWAYFNQETVRELFQRQVVMRISEVVEVAEVAAVARPTPTATPPPDQFAALAEEAYLAGRLDESIENYRQAAKLAPNNVDYHTALARLLVLRSATQYEGTREATLQDALQAANSAVLADPESSKGYAVMAMALDWNGQPEEAAAQALRAIEIDPNYAPAHAYLAEAYVDLERWTQAQQEAQTALDLAPYDVDVHRNYGYVLESLGDYAGAANQYEQALSLHPNLAYLKIALARNYRVLGRYDEAVELLLQVGQYEPNNPLVYLELGWTYHTYIGDDGSALEYLQQAVDIDPEFMRPWVRIGAIRYAQGEYQLTIDALERAIELGAEDADVYYQLGMAYIYLSDCPTGLPHLQRAQEMAEGDERIAEIVNVGLEQCAEFGFGPLATGTPGVRGDISGTPLPATSAAGTLPPAVTPVAPATRTPTH
jgi:tetratricopeptide (TPR) repeat protein